MEPQTDYIVYVDESGDHGMDSTDPTFPVFVLAFCIFHKETYFNSIIPRFLKLKFDHFGHDMVVLHEREMRKRIAPFHFDGDPAKGSVFMDALSAIIDDAPFTIIACVIRKPALLGKHGAVVPNPYHVAVLFGLERLRFFLRSKNAVGQTHVIFEERGKGEDRDLELEFRRICDGANWQGSKMPFSPIFVSKKCNSCGLQLADLVARPIGRYVINPEQPNRAYEILERKLYRSGSGRIDGFGLKTYP